MNHLPFDKPGQFYRGNLHTHSTLSDGALTPEQVCRRYREAGYDFISLTEHFMANYGFPMADTRPFRTPDFTTIIGAELHTDRTTMDSIWHILAVGLPLDFAPSTETESAAALAARATAAGAFVAVAHPNWYALSEADIETLGAVDAIEIFNGIAVDANDSADSWHIADVMLGRGQRYFAVATDDFHAKEHHSDFGRGWVWVKSTERTPEALLAALKAGAYYSSTGPEIYDVQIVPGQTAYVRCSPVERIFVTGRGSSSARAQGHGLAEAEIDLRNFSSPYCRITVRDAHGGRAWTNPIWY